jgi:pimeloyl-ACP methyl ester carboxylesterase
MIALLPGGLEMAYDEAGSGIPLLFVHGWPHDRSLWAGQLSGLATSARCIAPDLRGFGASTVRGPFTMEQYADDLAAFLVSLGITRAVVCGLSMGGYIAFALLRRHRALVRGLVLADTRATADTVEARESRERLITLIEEEGVETLAEQQLERMVGRSTRERRPQLAESLQRMMAATPAQGAIGGQRAMIARSDSTDLLPKVELPTLVIGGMEDVITPPHELRALSSAISKSRLELLEGCGHVCPFERPAAFNHVLSEFLHALSYH